MGIAHRGVGEQDAVLRLHPLGERHRTVAIQNLAAAIGGGQRREFGHDGRRGFRWRTRTVAHFGVTVDGDVGNIAEQFGRAILARLEVEQLGRRVDEPRRIVIFDEIWMRDDILKERQIGRDATNAELTQSAVHAGDGFFSRRRPAGHFFQQWIVIARDHRTGISRAAVEAHTEPGRTAIGGDAAIVRNEIMLGIFGGDAALDRVAIEVNVGLQRHAGLGRTDHGAIEQMDLRLDDVDAGHFFGDGMLDLNAWVHFDEVEFVGVGIHQEFDGTGATIIRGIAETHSGVGQLLAHRVIEVRRGGALDDLLIAPLHRAVALEQMHQIAVIVADQLHFDVAGALDQLFEIHLVLAERRLGFALAFRHFGNQRLFIHDAAHAATAAAP